MDILMAMNGTYREDLGTGYLRKYPLTHSLTRTTSKMMLSRDIELAKGGTYTHFSATGNGRKYERL